MKQTVVEKILARASGSDVRRSATSSSRAVDLAMSHENAALVINQFKEIYEDRARAAKSWDPSKIAIIFDHRVPAESARRRRTRRRSASSWPSRASRSSTTSAATRAASATRSSRSTATCGPAGRRRDRLHTTSHGALGAFAFGIGATEMASVWALGTAVNVEVPATIKVEVTRALPRARRPEGSHPPPHRPLIAPRARTSASSSSTGETIANMSTSGRLVALQHVRRGGRDGRHRAGRRGDRALPARGGRRDGPARPGRARCRRRLRTVDRDRRLDARAARRVPAHRGQREAGRRGRRASTSTRS